MILIYGKGGGAASIEQAAYGHFVLYPILSYPNAQYTLHNHLEVLMHKGHEECGRSGSDVRLQDLISIDSTRNGN